MTPEFLMGRLGRKCLFPTSGNTQVYREGQTQGKQSFHICLIKPEVPDGGVKYPESGMAG